MSNFNKNNWYWRLGDGRTWSTRAAAFVADAEARAWAEAQGMERIPASPADESGENSEQGLRDALRFYGLPLGELATTEDLQKQFVDAIQQRLDEFAQTRNYDNTDSMAKYIGCSVPKFATEAAYMRDAVAETWARAYEILDAVLSGARPMPTIEEVIAELPPLAWPEG